MEPSLASIESYDRSAAELCGRYETLSTAEIFPSMVDLFPKFATVLDVGCGSGRDAAHFASYGNFVVGVDPSDGMLAEAERRHPGEVSWLKDSLPLLEEVRCLDIPFDFILLGAVWMHIHPSDRPQAFATLAGLLARGGTLMMSLRLGPAEPGRAMYPVFPEEVRRFASNAGLRVVREQGNVDHLGREAITWHTMALRAPTEVSR